MPKARRYINKTEAGRLYGCSATAVRAMCTPGKALHPALVKRGDKILIDSQHPAAKSYRAEFRVSGKPEKLRVIPDDAPIEPPASTADLEDQIRAYWNYTLREIVDKCGTIAAFYSLLQSADKIESIHAKQLAADKSTGELISREYVSKHVLSLVEKTNQRLLAEMPVKLSYEIHGKCSTGASVEDIQEAIKLSISRELKSLKRDSIRAIKKATD